ncbi:lysylphosphatidylglycerol synthase transmembrane domain-containing protein [Thermophagus sp. OGC60D27]|uniref:lysylphosphatidylglycerol synthase transmembrane domain-containing protein n=1 Tax=Thermophagus sp. OGC60D27 TaxID=3458415 RepID=UPI00403821DF
MKKSNRPVKTLKLIAKILISVGVLWYITTKIDLSEIGSAITRANLWFLFLSLLIYMISQVASSFRLNILFRLIPVQLSEKTNLKLYWLGLFYNLFLPGGVGGDGFKIYLLNHYLKVPVKRSLGAIFADRLSGLTVIMTFILMLLYYIDYSIPYKAWMVVLIPFPLLALNVFLRWVLPHFLRAFARISIWSVVVQGVQMISAVCLLYALGVKDFGRYDDYLFLFFLSSIMASVPVTLGGIGAREFTFLMGAEYLDLQVDTAVALSLLFFMVSVVCALPGLRYTLKPRKLLMNIKD